MPGNPMIWLCRNEVENKYVPLRSRHIQLTTHSVEKGCFMGSSIELDVGMCLLPITLGHQCLAWDPLVKICKNPCDDS